MKNASLENALQSLAHKMLGPNTMQVRIIYNKFIIYSVKINLLGVQCFVTYSKGTAVIKLPFNYLFFFAFVSIQYQI